MKTLAKISESILDQDQIEQETDFNLEMGKLFRRYFGCNDSGAPKCKYELKNKILYLESWNSAARLDDNFLKVVKKYGTRKIVWDVHGCRPCLYGKWDLDIEILKGCIRICAKEFAADLKCSGPIEVVSDCIFRNAKITASNMIRFEHGCPQQFLGTTQFPKCPEIQMYGQYMNHGKWEKSIFIDKLIKLGVIKDGHYGQISFVAPKNNPKIKITDIIGKNWPDVGEVWLYRLSTGYIIYICKDSVCDKNKLRGCYSIEQYPIEGGWTIYFGHVS